jgi:hypothetical protein
MQVITVPKDLCQASFDWHFIHEVVVLERSEQFIRVQATLARGQDPYLERLLGHYSSGLLLEISKQMGKVAYQLLSPSDGPVRYMVREITMAFPAYTILDERFPLRVIASVEATEFRKTKVQSGNTIIQFHQGDTMTAEIRFAATVVSPQRETAIEDMFRDALTAVHDASKS